MSGWILSIGNLLILSHVKAMLGILKTIQLIDVTMIIDWDYELLTFNPGTHYTSGNMLRMQESTIHISIREGMFAQGLFEINHDYHKVQPILLLSANVAYAWNIQHIALNINI